MKTAIVFGSSGLVGQQLVQQLIQNNTYQKIKLFVRKNPNLVNSKIEIIETKFDNFDLLSSKIKGDDCFFCIGTTKKNSPDKSEYKQIELDMVMKTELDEVKNEYGEKRRSVVSNDEGELRKEDLIKKER